MMKQPPTDAAQRSKARGPLNLGKVRIFAVVMILIPILVWMMLPRVNSVSNYDSYAICSSHLKTIASACEVYAKANGGSLPPDLATIYLTLAKEDPTYNAGHIFVCPTSMRKPTTGPTITDAALKLQAPENCSYLYLGNGRTWPIGNDEILAFEIVPPGHNSDFSAVLLGSKDTEFIQRKESQKLMKIYQSGKRRICYTDLKSSTTQP